MSPQRPREELGKLLRKTLHCPACPKRVELEHPLLGSVSAGGEDRPPLRVVAYRAKSIRLECPDCGLRFSIDPVNLADMVARKATLSDDDIEFEARDLAKDDPGRYLEALARVRAVSERRARKARNTVLEPHRRALESTSGRSSRRIRFPKKPTKAS